MLSLNLYFVGGALVYITISFGILLVESGGGLYFLVSGRGSEW